MPEVKVKPYDSAEFLEDEEDRRLYLEAVEKFGNRKLVDEALEDIERSRLMYGNGPKMQLER